MKLSNLIKEYCFAAFIQAFPEQTEQFDRSMVEITEATQAKFGHYQCNSAMKLTKKLGVAPRIIAEKIVEQLKSINIDTVAQLKSINSDNAGKIKTQLNPENSVSSDKVRTQLNTADIDQHSSAHLFDAIEIAGPGFINLTLSPQFLAQLLNQLVHDPKLGIPQANPRKKVIIDYSSPNVAKEMHVGHLRTTIIGDSLARLFRFLDHEVLALNHIGDWGTQFGMLIAYLKEMMPEITLENKPDIHLGDLVQSYRAAKKRFDEDLNFKKEAQLEVVHLQAGDPLSLSIWQYICEISRRAYQMIYDLLDIHLIERGESFYNPLLPKLIADLEQKNLITLSEGAKCIFLEGYTNRNDEPLPLILQKGDGAYNYATTDLASLKHRIEIEKGDWIIYVVDAGQSVHLNMVFDAAKKAGFLDSTKTRVDHVDFGLVLRPDGKKFKTREGETERLIDLLLVAIDKAKEALSSRNPDMPEKELEESALILGIDAVKYADLSCNRTSDYMFSYDKMLSFEGNTAAFLLYAYVRILGIQRKINLDINDLLQEKTEIILKEPAEIALGLLICQFPDVLNQMAEELLPHRLTDYLYRLAEKFHAFFHHCRVEGDPAQNSRLLLSFLVARVLKQGLEILGLKTLNRM